MPLFQPNLEKKGRIIRVIAAAALGLAAVFVWDSSRVAAVALIASALFMAFEAARGWCLVRACGVKTKF